MDIEAIYQRGFQARCDGRYSEAKVELARVLSMDPRHVNARHQMALIQGFEGDFDGSLNSLAGLSREVPGNLEVLYDLAMTEMMLGMYDEACAKFKKIIAIDPSHSKAQQQLVYCP